MAGQKNKNDKDNVIRNLQSDLNQKTEETKVTQSLLGPNSSMDDKSIKAIAKELFKEFGAQTPHPFLYPLTFEADSLMQTTK